jgi:hypothetical protein
MGLNGIISKNLLMTGGADSANDIRNFSKAPNSMSGFYRAGMLFSLAVFVITLSGCPPLNYKMYIRNTTPDSIYVTLIFHSEDNPLKANIAVKSKDQILPINKKTVSLLNDSLTAIADNGKIMLTIPPKSTVFLSDIIKPVYISQDKWTIIRRPGRSDTIIANYPYRGLKGFKQKSDPSYNYFYRTIIYYDIK